MWWIKGWKLCCTLLDVLSLLNRYNMVWLLEFVWFFFTYRTRTFLSISFGWICYSVGARGSMAWSKTTFSYLLHWACFCVNIFESELEFNIRCLIPLFFHLKLKEWIKTSKFETSPVAFWLFEVCVALCLSCFVMTPLQSILSYQS